VEQQQQSPNSQLKKGVLELCILSILQQQQEAYPSNMLENMREANLIIPEGTLYPILTRLKNAAYLTYRWVESTEGPPRKYFSLTAEGIVYRQQLFDAWQELNESVSKILQQTNTKQHS
jgi:PadR family transcriptional regulator, regulatory protein PadR